MSIRRTQSHGSFQLTTTLLMGVLVVSAVNQAPAEADDGTLDRSGPRVVFLGDSIAVAGHYINDIETTLLLQQDGRPIPVIIGLGLGSETASGLTEPDHPFPRPDVHERLGRVLKATRPDVVVACYGINDGIYHPFSEERFTAYRNGISKLIRDVRASGARIVLLTPPPYAGSVAPSPAPQEGQPYGYKTPDPNYDAVLAKYAEWVLSLESQDGVEVIDIRTPMREHLAESYRDDPIHPTPAGHRVMAEAILDEWGKIDPATSERRLTLPPVDDRRSTLRSLVGERRATFDGKLLWEIGHQRPGKAPSMTMDEAEQAAARIDREILRVLQLQ